MAARPFPRRVRGARARRARRARRLHGRRWRGRVRDAFSDVRSEPVEPGWEDRWKEFHRPVRAGGLWIGPPWIEPPPASRRSSSTRVARSGPARIRRRVRASSCSRRSSAGASSTPAAARASSPSRPRASGSRRSSRSISTRWPSRSQPRRRGRTSVAVEVARGRRPARRASRRRRRRREHRARRRRATARASDRAARGHVRLPRRGDAASAAAGRDVDRLELEGWAADVLALRH